MSGIILYIFSMRPQHAGYLEAVHTGQLNGYFKTIGTERPNFWE